MTDDTIHSLDNVFAVQMEHRVSCRCVWGPLLPEKYCDCGALTSKLSRTIHSTHNIVTNDGEIYYAEQAMAGIYSNEGTFGTDPTPTASFDAIALMNSALTPAAADTTGSLTGTTYTQTLASSGSDNAYPRINDPDGDNPGTVSTASITWRVSIATGSANNTWNNAAVVLSTDTLGAGTNEILNHAAFSSSFTKTASDTLKVYVNHTFNGT